MHRKKGIVYMHLVFFICILIINVLCTVNPDQLIIHYENKLIRKKVKKVKHIRKTIYIKDIQIESHSLYMHTDKNADVLVLIHGFAGSSLSFKDLFDDLSEHYNILAIDLPGFGRSHTNRSFEEISNVYENNTSEFHKESVIELLRILGIDNNNIILTGHSYGGYVSIKVAKDLIPKKLVLMCPAGIFPTLGKYGMYWAYFFDSCAPYFLSKANTRVHNLFPYITNNMSYNLHLLSNPKCIGQYFIKDKITIINKRACWNKPVLDHFNYIKCPITLIYSDTDTIIPLHSGEIIHTIYNHPLYTIKNSGHNILNKKNSRAITECITKENTHINHLYIDWSSIIPTDYMGSLNVHKTSTIIKKLYSIINDIVTEHKKHNQQSY